MNTVRVVSDLSLARETPRIGHLLGGRYHLDAIIGTGGFGVVFAATDCRLRKRVAVKALSPRISDDPGEVERFRREALAASAIRHEGIVDVTDFDVDSDDTRFIVMEFLDGIDLAGLLEREQSLPVGRSLYIAAQAASALAAAHEAGIVHRDLKPANIYLTSSRLRTDFVKVIDFGISKVLHRGGRESITSSEVILGTPHYMSNEHARGLRLDGRADVYALGVILYELVVGRPPFEGRTAIEILTVAGTQDPVPPSQRRPDLELPPGFDPLILGALARDRDRRFGSMEAFGAAITACLREVDPGLARALAAVSSTEITRPHPAIAAPRPSTLEQLSGEIERALVPAVSARTSWPRGLGLLALAATAGLSLFLGWHRPDPPPVRPAAGSDARPPVRPVRPAAVATAVAPATAAAPAGQTQPTASETATVVLPRRRRARAPRSQPPARRPRQVRW